MPPDGNEKETWLLDDIWYFRFDVEGYVFEGGGG